MASALARIDLLQCSVAAVCLSRRLQVEARELRQRAGEVRRQSVWLQAGQCRQILGASDASPHPYDVIRAKIAAGLLPRELPARMWVGPGLGKTCDGCGLPITSDQRECEFEPPGSATIRLHRDCLQAWQIAGARQTVDSMVAINPAATRMAAVLRACYAAGLCIECLAARLDLSLKDARDTAQVLVARRTFRAVKRECYACGRVADDVIVFTADQASPAGPRSSAADDSHAG